MQNLVLDILRDINPYIEITPETNLLEEDILDSMGIVLLIQELGEKAQITVDLEKVTLQDFQNVTSILSLIERIRKEK